MGTRASHTLWVWLIVCWVTAAGGQDLYDDTAVPVLQLKFAQTNWWAQLQANYQAKTNIPATLIVDDVTCEGVGSAFAATPPTR